MDGGNQRAIGRVKASIRELTKQRSAALATASQKAQEARDLNAKAEAYEALARDAISAGQGLRTHAGVPANACGVNSFTGKTGTGLGDAVTSVKDLHSIVNGAWKGAAFDAFNTKVGEIRNGIELPTEDIRAFFTTSADNCDRLAGEAAAKGAEQRTLAVAASAASALATVDASNLLTSINTKNAKLAELEKAGS